MTGIITQGARDFGHIQYVAAYRVAFSNDGVNWTQYGNKKVSVCPTTLPVPPQGCSVRLAWGSEGRDWLWALPTPPLPPGLPWQHGQ